MRNITARVMATGIIAVATAMMTAVPPSGCSFPHLSEGASTIKVPILMKLYKGIETGAVSRDEMMTYLRLDYEGGAGSIQTYPMGSTWSLGDLAARMMKESDNVAKNMLLRRLGCSAVEGYAHDMGAVSFDLNDNRITPEDMGLLLEKLFSGQAAGPGLAAEHERRRPL